MVPPDICTLCPIESTEDCGFNTKGVNFASGGIREGASGHKICFVHPKASATHPFGGEGVLIELVQAPKAVIESFNNSSKK